MLPTYRSLDEMWCSVVEELVQRPKRSSRVADAREIVGWAGRLQGDRTFLCNARRAACPVYASAELIWYLSRSDDGAALLPYAPSYEHYLDGQGKAFGAYGHRIMTNAEGDDLLELAVGVCRKFADTNTRQCHLAIWQPRDLRVALHGQCKDLPCTCSWTLYPRDGKLDWVTYMRSNDAWKGLPYDVYCFTCIQRLVAAELGMEPGDYVHMVGSMHLYDQNYVAAREALTVGESTAVHSHEWKPCGFADVPRAVESEATLRSGRAIELAPASKTLLDDAVRCVAWHWGLRPPVMSSALADGLGGWIRRKEKANAHSRGT